MHTRIIGSLLTGLMALNIAAANAGGRPKLVVGIVVDQLRTDYVEYLRHLFGENGFNRLIANGVYIPDVDFNAAISDPVAATAIAYTGSYPLMSGITSAYTIDPSNGMAQPVLLDTDALGNSTRQTLSPAALPFSTISDEIAIDGAGLGAIYAVATDPQQAIIMAGHSGNAALWINDTDGNWASTTWYRDFPTVISQRNRLKPLSQRLDTLSWKPAMALDRYPGVPAQKRQYPFRYMFPRSDKGSLDKFKASAPANTEVTDVALELLQHLNLGTRGDAIDMLNVAYTAAPFKYVRDGDYRLELEDTYLRLDGQLGRLLVAIDSKIGLQNTVVFLTSTGYYDDATADDPKYRIPTGEISLKRAKSLLNSYLSARYGNADYVKAIRRGEVFLDSRQLETHGADQAQARREAREFLLKMSGVANVATLDDILADMTPEGERLRNSVNANNSADLFITFQPGWKVTDDLQYPTSTWQVRLGRTNTPAIIMAPGAETRTITTPVDAAVLAPTVTSALHIRAPNAASHRPVKL